LKLQGNKKNLQIDPEQKRSNYFVSIFNFEEFQAQDIDSPSTLRALKQLGYKQQSLKKKTND
jgi:hypothetical protein